MMTAMRWMIPLALAMAGPALAQEVSVGDVARWNVAQWNPAAPYISPGQDEPGYRAWYMSASWRPGHVRQFNDYLDSGGVAGVVPTWQLLRTATSWQRCGSEPFEIPPTAEWPHIVQTLRYIRDHVVPVIGPVEAVSGYRNPHLNICAGGARESAHKQYSAIDMVPVRPIGRSELMRRLCAVHAREGRIYRAGLGFYAFVRFHVDSTRFRRWGVDSMPGAPSCPAIVAEPVIAAAPDDMPGWAAQPAGEPAQAPLPTRD